MTRTTFLAILLSGTLLSGCNTIARNSYSSVDNEAKREFLTYAGKTSPVLVTARSTPFPEGDAAAAAKVASTMSANPYLRAIGFTGEPSAADQAHFRIVVAFDTPAALNPTALCTADSVAATPVVGELTLHMAFCAREETLSASIVKAPGTTGLDDPRFTEAVDQAVFELFPRQDDRDRDRGDPFTF